MSGEYTSGLNRIALLFFAASGPDASAAGFDDSLILKELSREWGDRKIPGRQELEEEGQRVLREWAENPDRIPY